MPLLAVSQFGSKTAYLLCRCFSTDVGITVLSIISKSIIDHLFSFF